DPLGGPRQGDALGRGAPLVGGLVAELTPVVAAPTDDGALRVSRAAVTVAERHLHGVRHAFDSPRRLDEARAVRSARLERGVVARAQDLALASQDAEDLAPRRERHAVGEARDRERLPGGGALVPPREAFGVPARDRPVGPERTACRV